MVISVGQLAVELRLATDPASPPPEPLSGVLSRTLATATQLVGERVRTDTPQVLRDAATVAVASYVFDRPSASGGTRFSNAWANSGAEQMLSRWIDRRAAVIGGPDQGPYEAPDDAPDHATGGAPNPLIDAVLTSANPISPQAQGDGRRATLQAISSARFEAVVEASFSEDGQAIAWQRILPFTSDGLLPGDDRLTLSPLLAYRARLLSGGPVRVLLG